jgi:hypothetical protein
MYHALIFQSFPLQAKRPGGAYRMATFLREQGWDVEVIDWVDQWSLEELQELVKMRCTSNTKFFGFSTFFAHWPIEVDTFAVWLKQAYPNISTILGGQSRPRMTSKGIDLYITGYGEKALLAVIEKLLGNTNPLTTITYDSRFLDKKVILANHSYPSFPMKSLMIEYEKRDFVNSNEWLTVEYSRGCMFKCLYCNFPVLGVKGDYTRDADDYVTQLNRAYDDWGVTKYITADETFNDRTDKIIKFADATEKLNFTPYISAFIRADLLVSRKQDWDHLIRMGMLAHYYGVESMHTPSAKSIGKGMASEKLQEGLIEVKNYFNQHTGNLYRGHISLIAGLPHETKETLEKTANWCVDNWSGEGSEMWPLEIPINETLDVPSLLTTKWREYGYWPRSEELIETDSKDMVDDYTNISHVAYNLDWVNDHMSYRESMEIATQLREKMIINGGVGAFGLQEFSYSLSLEDTLNLRYGHVYKGNKVKHWLLLSQNNLKATIKEYIYKKLSL